MALCANEVERLSLFSPDLQVRLDVRQAPPALLDLDGAACFASLDGQGGSGLGLPITRALARAMGGDLDYEAGFDIRLPVGSPNQSDAPPLAGGSTLN